MTGLGMKLNVCILIQCQSYGKTIYRVMERRYFPVTIALNLMALRVLSFSFEFTGTSLIKDAIYKSCRLFQVVKYRKIVTGV